MKIILNIFFILGLFSTVFTRFSIEAHSDHSHDKVSAKVHSHHSHDHTHSHSHKNEKKDSSSSEEGSHFHLHYSILVLGVLQGQNYFSYFLSDHSKLVSFVSHELSTRDFVDSLYRPPIG